MAASDHGHHHESMWVFPSAETATKDVVDKTFGRHRTLSMALGLAAVLTALGVIGFIVRAATDGFAQHNPWGYYFAMFSFVFMITGAAPLVAVAMRITKNHWRRPLSRISEMFGLAGVLNILLFIPAMLALPPIANPGAVGAEELAVRRTIWFQVPIGAPHWWEMLGVIFLAMAGLTLLWVSATPDMAEARLSSTGFRRRLYSILAGHWRGTKRQWNVQKASLALMGAWYFLLLVFVQFLISSDYGQSLIPGWKDSIFPVLYTVTSFQASLGMVLVIAYIMRRWGGYQEYIGVSQFWAPSKILLGITLLWTYHLFAFFITFWYGRLEIEQNIIRYLLFESYGGIFWANLFFTFFFPFFLLLWNPVRRSAWGPSLAGLLVVAGAFLFNIRIFVASFNAVDAQHLFGLALEEVPPPVFPDIWDILMVLGGIGAAALVYLAASRVIPMISLWEVKEGAMYQRMGTLFRGRYLILAKPE